MTAQPAHEDVRNAMAILSAEVQLDDSPNPDTITLPAAAVDRIMGLLHDASAKLEGRT